MTDEPFYKPDIRLPPRVRKPAIAILISRPRTAGRPPDPIAPGAGWEAQFLSQVSSIGLERCRHEKLAELWAVSVRKAWESDQRRCTRCSRAQRKMDPADRCKLAEMCGIQDMAALPRTSTGGNLLAAVVNTTVVADENLTVGSAVWLPAERLAPGR